MFELNQFSEFQPAGMCFKGGGGGSSSGKVGFPAYMETLHSAWLDTAGTDVLTLTMADAMNAAYGSSPWLTADGYDPDSDISAWETAMSNFRTFITGIDEDTEWANSYAQADTSIDGVIEADITESISDFADQLDDEIEVKVLPRFRRGMQDINAVVSSAYPIGAALIEAFRNREVAKHSSTIRISLMDKKSTLLIAGTEQMLKLVSQKYGFEESYSKAVVDSMRIKIVAKGEQLATDFKYDEADALWDLEVFQYGSNLLGAIGSGVVSPGKAAQPSQAQSAIGGAMSGAAAGAMIPVIGPVVGGLIGAASAFI